MFVKDEADINIYKHNYNSQKNIYKNKMQKWT